MSETKRARIVGTAVPVRGDDIDTDRITPARFLKVVTFDGLGEVTFHDDRAQMKERGETHPLDDSRFEGSTVMLVNKNFGCGSSREHAPQAIRRWGAGIQAIVGESFAEIFFGNCLTIGIPAVTVDADSMKSLMAAVDADPKTPVKVSLETMIVSTPSLELPASMPEAARNQLLEGNWDTTGELLAAQDAIARTVANQPYWNGWR